MKDAMRKYQLRVNERVDRALFEWVSVLGGDKGIRGDMEGA